MSRRSERIAARTNGTPPVLFARTRTPAQAAKDTAAGRINKDWKITRRDKSSRGLRRKRVECYQLAGLQSLLHMPKFMNWIRSHNVVTRNDTVQYPCLEKKKVTKNKNHVKYKKPICPACAMKGLINVYWGNYYIGADGGPEPLNHDSPALRKIHKLADSWFDFAADGDRLQQDSGEFQDHLLRGCDESVAIADNQADWHNQYDALFKLQTHCDGRCPCGAPLPMAQPQEEIGIPNVPVLDISDEDSVDDALVRYFAPIGVGHFTCPTCGLVGPANRTESIEASPHYLRIKLGIVTAKQSEDDNIWNLEKNMNPIEIPRFLDLTDLQLDKSTELHYKLSSVIPHEGQTLDSGHYISSVRGLELNYRINDHVVRPIRKEHLSENPQRWPGELLNPNAPEEEQGKEKGDGDGEEEGEGEEMGEEKGKKKGKAKKKAKRKVKAKRKAKGKGKGEEMEMEMEIEEEEEEEEEEKDKEAEWEEAEGEQEPQEFQAVVLWYTKIKSTDLD